MPTLFQQPQPMTPPSTPSTPSTPPASQPQFVEELPTHHDAMNLFTAYAENPTGMSFETQQVDEEVILFMRQHFIINIPWIFATILLFVAPFTIIPFFFMLVPFPIAIPSTPRQALIRCCARMEASPVDS
jgi:hypothetical protein